MSPSIKKHRVLVFLVLISAIPILLVYLPFALHLSSFWGIPLGSSGLQQIFANWDGPNYVYNAISGYNPTFIEQHPFDGKPAAYYPAHFPMYSLLIRIYALPFGYFWGSILLNLISGIVLNIVFYHLIARHTKHPLWLTFAFTVFPPRYWIVRSVISPEMLMVSVMLGSLYMWNKKKPLYSALLSMLAVLFKFQAMILAPVYILTIAEALYRKQKVAWQQWLSPLFPILGFGLVSGYYAVVQGRWDAYFVAQKIAGLSTSIPFGMFNYAQKWVGTGWMETAALYFIGMMILAVKLWKDQNRVFFWFTVLYIAMLSVIPQVDIMRLAMPLAPLFFYAFHESLSSTYFKYGLLLSLPFLYLHTINYLMTNVAPITDWSLFR